MLSVEDWAEIRRLRRSEELSISEIARVMGCLAEHGEGGVGLGRAAEVSSGRRRGRWSMRSSRGSGSCCGRIRRMPATVIAERIGWTHSIRTLSGRVRGAAAGVSAAGPGVTDDLCGRGDRAVRFLVPRRSRCRSGSARSGPPTQLPVLTMVMRVFAVGISGADPDPQRRGPVRGLVAADRSGWARCRGCWSGTVKARSVGGGHGEPNSPRTARRSAARWRRRCWSANPPIPKPRAWSNAFTTTWSGRFCPAGSFTSPADFNSQLAAWLVRANHRQHRALGCRPADRIEADRRRCWRCRRCAPGDRVAALDSAAARSLRPPGRQRLLGAPGRDRTAHRGHRRPGPGPGVLRRHGGRRPSTGSGPNIRRSPIPTTSRPPSSCAATGSTSSARARARRGRTAPADRLRRRCSASTGRWRDGHQDHAAPAAT